LLEHEVLQHFDREGAVVLEIVGEIDGGHAAGAEIAFDAVAVGNGRGEAVEVRCHRGPKMQRGLERRTGSRMAAGTVASRQASGSMRST